jgi:hypothetical protein
MGIFSRLFKSKKQGLSVQQMIEICEILEIVNLICKRKHRLYELGVIDVSFDEMMIEKSTITKFHKEGLLDILGKDKMFGTHSKRLLEIVDSGVNDDNIFTIHYTDSFLKTMKRHLYCEINNINIDDLYFSNFDKISTKQISEGFKVENYDRTEIMNEVKEMNEKLKKVQESIKK